MPNECTATVRPVGWWPSGEAMGVPAATPARQSLGTPMLASDNSNVEHRVAITWPTRTPHGGADEGEDVPGSSVSESAVCTNRPRLVSGHTVRRYENLSGVARWSGLVKQAFSTTTQASRSATVRGRMVTAPGAVRSMEVMAKNGRVVLSDVSSEVEPAPV
ncbi:hypothetical protein SPBR_07950 [Sporothrix brasiliensis 5110]|uniref:Uncharacterized protein n=1 Tax=Sporothrix brasiliensis 5110 TaxID=1398154 RepID=A0A0C2IIA1_9PEZI|nr:uncharacterized protein SPBR_07950 [Sporothrix brasiliensis 5110]KIH88926.1 hypothetical protein SPBR_07950 [Sporothrix brasiliensis 5110]